MAAISGAKSSLLHRLLAASLPRRPAATAAAAAFSSAAAASVHSTGRAVLRSSRLGVAVRRLGALHGSAIVCSAAGDGLVEVLLKVDGMVCDGCSSRVEETLQKMAGVKKVHVDLEKGLATVTVEAGSQAEAAQPLAEAVKELGFDAEPQAASAA